MKVKLHESTIGPAEIHAVMAVLDSGMVTMGAKVKEFERAFIADTWAQGVTSNSGSSANLLAIAALVSSGDLNPGDEVIVSALSWSTTVWPLVQHGLVPVIVDIDPVSLNIEPSEVVAALSDKTRAIMPVHVYGNPCEMNRLRTICDRHGLILIEDCCEALGAQYRGRPVGTFGLLSTFSFYFSHHMTTMEGGITVTDSPVLADIMRMQRSHGWLREVEDKTPYLVEGMDQRFTFADTGYNVRMMEVSAAMGLVQLPKLPDYVAKRRANVAKLMAGLKGLQGVRFQEGHPDNLHSFFGFAIICEGPDANEFRSHLENCGIETRPIICGNIARQPAMKRHPHRVAGTLTHADHILYNAFSVGCHQGMDDDQIEHVVESCKGFLCAA